MKNRVMLILCLMLLLAIPVRAEETAQLVEAYVSNGSKQISFLYPEKYEIEIDDFLGTAIFSTVQTKFL